MNGSTREGGTEKADQRNAVGRGLDPAGYFLAESRQRTFACSARRGAAQKIQKIAEGCTKAALCFVCMGKQGYAKSHRYVCREVLL